MYCLHYYQVSYWISQVLGIWIQIFWLVFANTNSNMNIRHTLPLCNFKILFRFKMSQKLDGLGPIDNRPSTNKLHQFVQKKKKKKKWHDMWHVTCDMWHVTWHVTHDMWYVWGVNILSKFQLPSSYGLWFIILWISGGKGWLNESMNKSMNDEAVYRTAPATPGLLISLVIEYNL